VTKASGRPSSSITIMLPNIRMVIHSMLMTADRCAARARD
jgi:hypothetical protein